MPKACGACEHAPYMLCRCSVAQWEAATGGVPTRRVRIHARRGRRGLELRQVAAFLAAELGLASVAPQRGWEALRAIGWTIQRQDIHGVPAPRQGGDVRRTDSV